MERAAVVARDAAQGRGERAAGECACAFHVADGARAGEGADDGARGMAVAGEAGLHHHILDVSASVHVAKQAVVREIGATGDTLDDMAVAVEGAAERVFRSADGHPSVGAHVDVGREVDDVAAEGVAIFSVEAVDHTDEPSKAIGIADGGWIANANATRRHGVDSCRPVGALRLVDEVSRDRAVGCTHGNGIGIIYGGVAAIGPVHEGVTAVG